MRICKGGNDLKRVYETPQIEIETYTLDAAIASNCQMVVNPGPGIGGRTECKDYEGPFMQGTAPLSVYNVNFYDDVPELCDCYTTGGGAGLWTS